MVKRWFLVGVMLLMSLMVVGCGAKFELSSLDISPEVYVPGDTVMVSATLANTGGAKALTLQQLVEDFASWQAGHFGGLVGKFLKGLLFAAGLQSGNHAVFTDQVMKIHCFELSIVTVRLSGVLSLALPILRFRGQSSRCCHQVCDRQR